MLFGQMNPTPYDINFWLFKFPVRIHISFWVIALLLTWNAKHPEFVLGSIFCIFFSILVHELGHAFVIRAFGYNRCEIWLYGGGGFATGISFGPWRNIAVSLAGPGAGLVLYGILFGLDHFFSQYIIHNIILYHMLLMGMFINLYWSLFNLLPIWPLDGGHVMRNLLYRFDRRNGEKNAMILSIIACIATAFYMYSNTVSYATIMLIYFGVMSYQEYERLRFHRW